MLVSQSNSSQSSISPPFPTKHQFVDGQQILKMMDLCRVVFGVSPLKRENCPTCWNIKTQMDPPRNRNGSYRYQPMTEMGPVSLLRNCLCDLFRSFTFGNTWPCAWDCAWQLSRQVTHGLSPIYLRFETTSPEMSDMSDMSDMLDGNACDFRI